MKHYDYLIVGAGLFGRKGKIDYLCKQKHRANETL